MSKNDDHKNKQNVSIDDSSEPETQTEDDECPPLTCDSPILSSETDPDQPTTSNDDSNVGPSSLTRASAIKAREHLRNGQQKYWKMILDNLSWSTRGKM